MGEMGRLIEERTVDAAACRDLTGKVWTLPRPNRHPNILWAMEAAGLKSQHFHDQGFVLDDGSFVDRHRAGEIALDAGQVTKLNWGPRLFSEDLW